MANLDENESLVEQLFREKFGFRIAKIPEGTSSTADFLVCDGEHSYLVELKTRYRSAEDRALREAQFEERGLAEFFRDIQRSSGVSSVISGALAQIEGSSPDASSIRLIFFLLRDFDVDERWHTILATLYGIKFVGDWSEGGEAKDCYYFSYSDFFRYRDRLDAVIILKESSGDAILCLNDHSPNIETLRYSRLAARFEGRTTDSPKKEADGEIWIVDGEVDRSNEQAVLAFLREKYSLSEMTMASNMGYTSATVIAPAGRDPE